MQILACVCARTCSTGSAGGLPAPIADFHLQLMFNSSLIAFFQRCSGEQSSEHAQLMVIKGFILHFHSPAPLFLPAFELLEAGKKHKMQVFVLRNEVFCYFLARVPDLFPTFASTEPETQKMTETINLSIDLPRAYNLTLLKKQLTEYANFLIAASREPSISIAQPRKIKISDRIRRMSGRFPVDSDLDYRELRASELEEKYYAQ